MRIYTNNKGNLGYDVRYGPSGPGQRRVRKITEHVKGQEDQVVIKAAAVLLQLEREAREETGEIRQTFTWGEAVVRFIREKRLDGKADLIGDMGKFKWMDQTIPGVKELKLEDFTRYWIDQHIREPLRIKGLAKATINKYLVLIGSVLKLASTEWETKTGYTWLERPPQIKKEKLSKKDKTRIRWLTRQEATRLVKELPDHLSLPFRFGLNTGLRATNIRELEWEQVDMVRKVAWVHPDEAKAGNAIAFPLNEEAMEIIRSQIGKHQRYIFSYCGKMRKTKYSSKAWMLALDRAGLRKYTWKSKPKGWRPSFQDHEYKYDDLRWHDATRHTWATWHVMAGTPLEILQELGGWSSTLMVKRYAHFTTGHLQKYAGNVLKSVDFG